MSDRLDDNDSDPVQMTPKHLAGAFLASAFLIGAIFWVAHEAPSLLSPDLSDRFLISLWLALSVLATLTYLLVITGWFSRRIAALVQGLATSNRTLIAMISVFVFGVFVCEAFGIAPPMSSWSTLETPTVSFFSVYTSLFAMLMVGALYLRRLVQELEFAVHDETHRERLYRRLQRIALILVLPLGLLGVVIGNWTGFAPSVWSDGRFEEDTVSALLTYLAIAALFPVIVFALCALVLVIIGAGWLLLRWIGGTETWRRLRGSRLPDDEFNAALRAEREAREEARRRKLAHRDERRDAMLDQRRTELEVFGPVTARLLIWTPVITFIAQAASFVTSYLGVKIYLGLRQENIEWFALALPTPGWFGLPDWLRLPFMSNDVLAVAASFLMAVIIWGFSTAAVAQVRKQRPVPVRIFALVMLLGVASTYTAFIMWNGELATREEMRLSLRETENYLAGFEQFDNETLVNAQREVTNLREQLASELEIARVQSLQAYLSSLRRELDRQRENDASAQRLEVFLQEGAGFFERYTACEAQGCLSELPGRGRVVRELEISLDAFKSNLSLWERLSERRSYHTQQAELSAIDANKKLGALNLDGALTTLRLMRANLIEASGRTPEIIIDTIDQRLQIPISQDARHAGQRVALRVLQDGIDEKRISLSQIREIWATAPLELPREVRVDEVRLDLATDIALLGQVGEELDDVLAERMELQARHQAELALLDGQVRQEAAADRLIERSEAIYGAINRKRDEIGLLAALDVEPVLNKLELLQSETARESIAVSPPIAAPEPLQDFVPTTLAWLIVDYAHLSVVPLLIQIMLDFGYTLVVVIAVAGLLPRTSTKAAV